MTRMPRNSPVGPAEADYGCIFLDVLINTNALKSDDMPNLSKIRVFDRSITLIPDYPPQGALDEFGGDAAHSALFCNVHMLMLSRQDTALASAMDDADYVFADGVPVAWIQSRIAGRKAYVLRGYEAVQFLCARAASQEKRVGLYGSTPEVLERLANYLKSRYSSLEIGLMRAPPVVEGELASSRPELDSINAAGLDYLFVGLGCPKQEKWIHRYAGELDCSVLGVGAAFDWLAGTTHMPPRWMAESGLAWLHRLAHDPLRLWKRYLIYNTAFVFTAAKVLLLRSRTKN